MQMLASAYMTIFRIIHIMAGIAWGGSAYLLVTYVQPSAAAIGPASGPFMMELLGKRRLVDGLIGLGSLTVIGGLFLYWHDWHAYGSFGTWIDSRFGAVITIGAVSAIVALAFGIFGTRPNVKRLLALARQVAGSGGPPSPEQAQQIARLQRLLKIFARVSLTFIGIAALCMAAGRYL
jgi:uncharacterized membrane protein